MVQGKRSIYREVTISVTARKKVHMNLCLILNGYRDRAVGTYKHKIIVNGSNKEKLYFFITTRHREQMRYIRTNNPNSAYAMHILNNRHEYGTENETLKLRKPCNKGLKINCW